MGWDITISCRTLNTGFISFLNLPFNLYKLSSTSLRYRVTFACERSREVIHMYRARATNRWAEKAKVQKYISKESPTVPTNLQDVTIRGHVEQTGVFKGIRTTVVLDEWTTTTDMNTRCHEGKGNGLDWERCDCSSMNVPCGTTPMSWTSPDAAIAKCD